MTNVDNLQERISFDGLAQYYLQEHIENAAKCNLFWWFGFVRAVSQKGEQYLYVHFLDHPDRSPINLNAQEALAYERSHKSMIELGKLIKTQIVDSRIIYAMGPDEAREHVEKWTLERQGIVSAKLVAEIDFLKDETEEQTHLLGNSLQSGI